MVRASLMRLLVAVALLDLVSARLGTADLAVEQVPSYFGEAAVVPVNAAPNTEAQEAPKLPILLTQSSLKLKESAPQQLKESAQPAPAQQHHGDLDKVCERTRKVLSAQADNSAMPTGPVYKECMAGLAPLREHQKDSDAVDTLSDCMALVNALMANKDGDCHDAVAVVQAAQKRGPAAPQVAIQPKPEPLVAISAPQTKDAKAKQEADALDLVSEAMSAVCTETVKDAEVGIKSEADAMRVATSVATICQTKAEKHLGATAAATSLTKEWCHQLDGRLTIALEMGFFFALSPGEAERQAAETNPYATTTRRKFCGRFVESLRKQAKEGTFYLSGPPPAGSEAPTAKAALAITPPSVPVVAVGVASESPTALPTLPPAPKAEAPPPSPPREPKTSWPASPLKSVVAFGYSVDQQGKALEGGGVDMLRLVQALSYKTEWKDACTELIAKLNSEEGSVTNEYALGDHETEEGSQVLTFNADDQGQIRKCAARLKVLAIQSGILGGSSAGDVKKPTSLIAIGMSLSSAEDAEAVMDSPWATDACEDIAHGFLTARLAHPGLGVPDYCPLYARDLQAMHAAMPAAELANQDKQQLRKRGSAGMLKRRMAQAAPVRATQEQAPREQAPQAQTIQELITQAAEPAAVPNPALRATGTQAKHKKAALITETSSAEDQEGMEFWGGLLQS